MKIQVLFSTPLSEKGRLGPPALSIPVFLGSLRGVFKIIYTIGCEIRKEKEEERAA